jgi:hypothetical protein
MVTTPHGVCGLCLQSKDLQESHLMPRALYRMARGDGSSGNQDPFLVTRKRSRQTSHQIKDHLLCRNCEQLFCRNGENYVMRLVTRRNGDFPLLKMLEFVPPTARGPGWKAHSIADTPTIDRPMIAYFAISVFWRASVHTWVQGNGEETRIDLGRKYNEEIRRYLLGETGVPKNTSLQVIACSDEINRKTFFTPRENQKAKDHSMIFLARGLLFFLRMSNALTVHQKRLSIVNEPRGFITTRNCGERPVWRMG